MLAMAAATVQVQKPGVNPREYILVAQGGDVATMVLSNTPWTKEDIARFELAAKRYHFMPILTPDKAYEDMLATLATGADMSIFDQLPHDVSPTTDDRPFFFNMKKPFDLLRKPAATGEINDFGTHLVVYLSIFTLLTSIFFILRPLYGSYVEQQLCWRQIWPYSHYFALIGLGFMFIEISQMQRLMIFLGHPIYGLCVVLFTLLLASGAGSMVQPLFQRRMPGLWMQPLFVCLVLAVVAWCMPMLTGYAKHYDILPRILISVIILIPLGFVMGMMFPAGATMVEERQSNILPWYWGINGAASVFASVFAIVLSLQCGISFTFWIGVACYALCVPLVWYIQQTSKEP